VTRTRITLTSALLGLLICPGSAPQAVADDPPDAPPPPATILLTGIIRDFREATALGGHPDFEVMPSTGLGRYAGNLAALIGADGKPVFTGNGAKVAKQWRDSESRSICYLLYDEDLDDTVGLFSTPSTGGITSASTFNQWFRDVPGVNMSQPLTLSLLRQDDGMYVFDDALDPYYASLGGFFPIDGRLFGNSGGVPDHNFHFTFDIKTQFTYDASAGQNFKFEGTDTVWLFIDGRLVNDLIGVHAAHDQFVDVDRLGLDDGEQYTLHFFFAQQRRPQSHFRIETNVLLEGYHLLMVSAGFD